MTIFYAALKTIYTTRQDFAGLTGFAKVPKLQIYASGKTGKELAYTKDSFSILGLFKESAKKNKQITYKCGQIPGVTIFDYF